MTMGDGTHRPIEDVRPGDVVLSCYGSGDFRPARVTDAFSLGARATGSAITHGAAAGEIVSTPEHTHFAGFRLGLTPQLHVTYLMRRGSHGCRVGVTRTYSAGRAKPVIGLQHALQRTSTPTRRGSSRRTTATRRRAPPSTLLSVRYGIPTIPFVAARPRSNGLVGNQALIDRVFAETSTRDEGGLRLRARLRLDVEHPHHAPATARGPAAES